MGILESPTFRHSTIPLFEESVLFEYHSVNLTVNGQG